MDERRRDEHERKREKRRQAEVELQIIPHVMQGTLRQKGGAVAPFRLPAGVCVRSAVLSLLVLRWCLEKNCESSGFIIFFPPKEDCQEPQEGS